MSAQSVVLKGHAIDEAWLALRTEPVLEPDLPIIDAHHHLFDHPQHPYLLREMLADMEGHDIRATIYVEASAMVRADGDPAFKHLGELEFANGIAAMSASGLYGPSRVCAGIVAHANLSLGARVREVLERYLAAAPDRFRGIRHYGAHDPNPGVTTIANPPPPGLYRDRTFREGFAELAKLGLVFDSWLYHPQLGDLVDLADAFPDTTIVVDHMGGRLGVGPYADDPAGVSALWEKGVRALAARPNVQVKIGGNAMRMMGHGFHQRPAPPSSEDLAAAWRPIYEVCLDAFGPQRCMFESNFPVDKVSCSYRILWNALKRLAAGLSQEDKAAMFAGNARRIYRLDPALIA